MKHEAERKTGGEGGSKREGGREEEGGEGEGREEEERRGEGGTKREGEEEMKRTEGEGKNLLCVCLGVEAAAMSVLTSSSAPHLSFPLLYSGTVLNQVTFDLPVENIS